MIFVWRLGGGNYSLGAFGGAMAPLPPPPGYASGRPQTSWTCPVVRPPRIRHRPRPRERPRPSSESGGPDSPTQTPVSQEAGRVAAAAQIHFLSFPLSLGSEVGTVSYKRFPLWTGAWHHDRRFLILS